MFLLSTNRKKTKLYSRLITSYMFHSYGNGWGWGRQGQGGRMQLSVAPRYPWVTLGIQHFPVSLGYTSRSLPVGIVAVPVLLMQMDTQRSWHPSWYFLQISLTPEAGNEKMSRLRLMSPVPQHFSEPPGESLKLKVTSLTGKWSKD